MNLQDRIHQLVKEHNGKPVNVARALGLNPSYLGRLRSGSRRVPREAVLKKLGLKVDYVLDKEQQP